MSTGTKGPGLKIISDDDRSEQTAPVVISKTPGFGPACEGEGTVFGARMPGYGARSVPGSVVRKWISLLKGQGIQRICCLLAQSQLGYYLEDFLTIVKEEMGPGNVLWSPIEDHHVCTLDTLRNILYFLKDSDEKGQPVAVHCAGGRGRTGLILSAWLVFGRGFPLERALSTVMETGREPYEAVRAGNAKEEEIRALLNNLMQERPDCG
jgi:protein-tyrosine phosphatase